MVDTYHLRVVSFLCVHPLPNLKQVTLVSEVNMPRLAVPYHCPCVSEEDFNMPLPAAESSSDYSIDPVHYHIAMCRIAIVVNRFKVAQRRGMRPLEEIVNAANNQLAEIIKGLPLHLQLDEAITQEVAPQNASCPWIPWQQYGLRLVILHNRLMINRELQKQWLQQENNPLFINQRAICLSSARLIIWISRQAEDPIERRPQW